jgi:hypothetical protein
VSLVGELKRRKVFKVGAAYLVVAWLAVQAASIGFPAFEAPPWALRVFILVALLGFPVALVMAWVFDVTPEGLERAEGAAGSGGRRDHGSAYWREKSWPAPCRPLGDTDFECGVAAATATP